MALCKLPCVPFLSIKQMLNGHEVFPLNNDREGLLFHKGILPTGAV